MAEAQARVEEAFEFHVPLDEGDDAAPATEDSGSEAAATEAAGENHEQPEQPTEELLTAEEAGVDEKSPEYQALRKKFIAAYQKKLEAERKKLKPREAAPEAQPVAEQPAAAAQTPESDDPFDAVYNVSFEGVKPSLQFREGSDLADYADELNELFAQAVPQYIKAALDGVKNNDKQFRQRMTVAERETKARDVISKYAEEISDHPEYAEKAQALAEFANKTRQLAIDDPELWVEMAERKYGLERGWRGASENEQAQEGQRNLRLASKTRSNVPRPTRSLPSLASGDGNMKFDAALSAAMRKAGL